MQNAIKPCTQPRDSKVSNIAATRRAEVVGTWNVETTLRNCLTGVCIEILHVVDTFSMGGALVEMGADSMPDSGSAGHGTWRHIEGPNFSAVLRFYRFSRNGRVAESRIVTRRLELDDSGNRFTGTALVEVFNESGSLVEAYGATESAKRTAGYVCRDLEARIEAK